MNAGQNIAQHRLGHEGTSLVGQAGGVGSGKTRLRFSRDGALGHDADGVGKHDLGILAT